MRECRFERDSADSVIQHPRRQKAAVRKKASKPNFEQIIEKLRAHAFHVEPSTEVAGVLVTKHGAGAVLVAGADKGCARGLCHASWSAGWEAGGPVAGTAASEIHSNGQLELSATASQLHAIHAVQRRVEAVDRRH